VYVNVAWAPPTFNLPERIRGPGERHHYDAFVSIGSLACLLTCLLACAPSTDVNHWRLSVRNNDTVMAACNMI
jgi:hypothetical protein